MQEKSNVLYQGDICLIKEDIKMRIFEKSVQQVNTFINKSNNYFEKVIKHTQLTFSLKKMLWSAG